MSNHYIQFRLSALWGPSDQCANPITPFDVMRGMILFSCLNAGESLRDSDSEAFEHELENGAAKRNVSRFSLGLRAKALLVGAEVCNVTLGDYTPSGFSHAVLRAEATPCTGPSVRVKARFFWSAYGQAKYDIGRAGERPHKGISWREFRVLAALLSVQTNSRGWAFIGWESIQCRANGYARKEDFKKALDPRSRTTIPEHLPVLSRKVINSTLDRLESLGFFAAVLDGSGRRKAYSFRLTREELRQSVLEYGHYRANQNAKINRVADKAFFLENKGKVQARSKQSASKDQEKGKEGA